MEYWRSSALSEHARRCQNKNVNMVIRLFFPLKIYLLPFHDFSTASVTKDCRWCCKSSPKLIFSSTPADSSTMPLLVDLSHSNESILGSRQKQNVHCFTLLRFIFRCLPNYFSLSSACTIVYFFWRCHSCFLWLTNYKWFHWKLLKYLAVFAQRFVHSLILCRNSHLPWQRKLIPLPPLEFAGHFSPHDVVAPAHSLWPDPVRRSVLNG